MNEAAGMNDFMLLLRQNAAWLDRDGFTTSARNIKRAIQEIERLRSTAQSVCDVVHAWEETGRTMVSVDDVATLVRPLSP